MEQTDRELLELAAKAAGYDVKPYVNAKVFRNLHFSYKGKNWNPLTDDGDALRLAVTLGLTIRRIGKIYIASGATQFDEDIRDHDNDPYAATRRAIVRAAAEIGKGMLNEQG